MQTRIFNKPVSSNKLTFDNLKKFLSIFESLTSDERCSSFQEDMLDYIMYSEIMYFISMHQPDEVLSAKYIPALKRIIANHVQRLHESGLGNQFNLSLPSNLLCLLVAHHLSELFHKSRMGLLLPTLHSYESIITTTDLRDDQLTLSEIVLSDDGKSFIEIRECLLSATEDGELKHTQLLDGNSPVYLSGTEKGRVINHSVESLELYAAICDQYRFLHDGTTVGACLQRLIEGLRAGGSRRAGQEMSAGERANLAIFEFSQLYANLPAEHHAALDGMQDSIKKNFRYYWEILALQQQQKIDTINRNFKDGLLSEAEHHQALSSVHANTQTCVELTANGLESILKCNQAQLFAMKIDGSVASTQESIISSLEENIRNKEHWFKWRLDQNAQIEKAFLTSDLYEFKSALGASRKQRKKNPLNAVDIAKIDENLPKWFARLNVETFERFLSIFIAAEAFEIIDEKILPLLTKSQRQLCYRKLINQFENNHIKELVAAGSHSFYLTRAGEVYVSGYNNHGVLGLQSYVHQHAPAKLGSLPANTEICQVASSGMHSLFLTRDGFVYECGSNLAGQFGENAPRRLDQPTLLRAFPDGTRICQISASLTYSLFLTREGKVYGYGSAKFRRLLKSSDQSVDMAVELTGFPGDTNISQAAAGDYFCLFLTRDGKVYVCGENQLTVPELARHWKPRLLTGFPADTEICQIAVSRGHALLLARDGKVYGFGGNRTGALGAEVAVRNKELVRVMGFPAGTEICHLATGESHSLFVARDGKVYGCGSNLNHQLGLGEIEEQREITQLVSRREPFDIVQVAAGDAHSVFLGRNGQVYACGSNLSRAAREVYFNDNSSNHVISPIEVTNTHQHLCAKYHLLASEENNSLRELSRLSRTCKLLNGLFKPKTHAAVLLQHVINADWQAACDMTSGNYKLMFEKTKGRDVNGDEIWMSPLQYAFYVHDTALQKHFKWFADREGVQAQYLEQAAEVTKFFDFTTIKTAYLDYMQHFKDRKKYLTLITYRSFEQSQSEKLGMAQRHYLPRHMLKQMCAQNVPNYDPFSIDATKSPWPTTPEVRFQTLTNDVKFIIARNDETGFDLFSNETGEIFGIDFAVVRGGYPSANKNRDMPVYMPPIDHHTLRIVDESIQTDFAVLTRLIEERRQQQICRLEFYKKTNEADFELVSRYASLLASRW